ncbi:MAG: helix-turn-helix domain-containing protein [Bacteroidales bacterium]|nr:helix-turn-helix domain-containing protein [Bacteroidales bacterium]
MESVNIPTDVYKDIVIKLDEITNRLVNPVKSSNPLSEKWLDISETCQLLKISKRTLQAYRDNGILSFSQIAGKIYFKVADLEEHLNKHYVRAFSSKKNKRYECNGQ